MEELKNEAKKEVGKSILNPLGWILILSLMATVSFPFVWVWASLWMATKISLTGFMLMILIGMVYKFIQKQNQSLLKLELFKDFVCNKNSNHVTLEVKKIQNNF